ncbi:hypothetical protein AABB24_005813 [Solanum stoloniferum]|uniref:Uncharacterized protein n=1 Tax=Solanum stoloniferum TaxID=62892 RepID=A0ABD2UYU4_9SOLN
MSPIYISNSIFLFLFFRFFPNFFLIFFLFDNENRTAFKGKKSGSKLGGKTRSKSDLRANSKFKMPKSFTIQDKHLFPEISSHSERGNRDMHLLGCCYDINKDRDVWRRKQNCSVLLTAAAFRLSC